MSVRSVLDSRHTYIMVSEVETLPLVCYGAHIDRIWIPCCWVGAMHKVPGTQVSYVCLYMYTRSLEHKHIGILEFMTHTFVPRNHELDAEHLLTTVTPLLFSFATRTYLRTERFKTETQQQREKEREREKEKEKENKTHQKKKEVFVGCAWRGIGCVSSRTVVCASSYVLHILASLSVSDRNKQRCTSHSQVLS